MTPLKSRHKKCSVSDKIGGDEFVSIPALDKEQGMVHAFTTRRDGLGARTNGIKHPDDWEADALITNVPGIAVGVETADCVPVLLFDPVKPAVAAVHAGWRSTVKKIVQKAVHRMHEEFGSEPARMIAAIGPAIGPECYEVDERVMGRVRDSFSFWHEVSTPRENDHWDLDLVKANKLELLQIGLAEKNVHALGLCTSCRRDLFYSFRAEGRTGRMLSVIMIKP